MSRAPLSIAALLSGLVFLLLDILPVPPTTPPFWFLSRATAFFLVSWFVCGWGLLRVGGNVSQHPAGRESGLFSALTVLLCVLVPLFYTLLSSGIGSWWFAVPVSVRSFCVFAGGAEVIAGQMLMAASRHALRAFSNTDVFFRLMPAQIHNGPYAHLSHPMYAGLFLVLSGSCLLSLNVLGALFLFAAILPTIACRAYLEERV